MNIYISYVKAETHELALQLRDKIRLIEGVTVTLFDSEASDLRSIFKRQEMIEASDMVVVVLSPDVHRDTMPPSVVKLDITHTLKHNKMVLVALGKPTPLPQELRQAGHIDLTQNTDASIRKLTAQIRDRLGIGDRPTVPLNQSRQLRQNLLDQLNQLDDENKS